MTTDGTRTEVDGVVERLATALVKSVSFRPVASFTAVRYEDLDNEVELYCPSSYDDLVSLLQNAKKYSPSDGLCYFPDNRMEAWATNRVRLTEVTFGSWIAYASTHVRLPRIVIYPHVDGKSPEKGPAPSVLGSPVSDVDSAATRSTDRRARQDEFRDTLIRLDGDKLQRCLVPGCTISFSTGFEQAQAAHIIPNHILDIRRQRKSRNFVVYESIMTSAEFERGHIDLACNGMLLCTGHHRAFDTFQWTVDPETFRIVVREGANPDQGGYRGTVLDFSHRPERQRPTAKVWTAYNEYIYNDKGRSLRAAAKVEEPAAAAEGAPHTGTGAGVAQ